MSEIQEEARAYFSDVLLDINNKINDGDFSDSPPLLKRRKPPQPVEYNEEPQQEPPKSRNPTFILKLFDRSVDLAQFCKMKAYEEDNALYPVCRAWVRDSASLSQKEAPITNNPETTLDKSTNSTENQSNRPIIDIKDSGYNDEQDLYELPKPLKKETEHPVLESVIEEPSEASLQAIIDSNMDFNQCWLENKIRWQKVRGQKCKQCNTKNARYEQSLRLLKEMFTSFQDKSV